MNADLLKQELVRDEGLRLKLYLDSVSKRTIGVGRNLDDVGISEAEAFYLLDNDIASHCQALDQHLPWWRALDEVRQRVLANMCFNIGITSLMGFHQMLEAIQANDYAHAADCMAQSLWAKEVGVRADRLIEMMRNG